MKALFTSLDTDSNGGLSKAEVQTAAPYLYRRFGAIDIIGAASAAAENRKTMKT